MFKKIINNIARPKQAAGIEVTFLSNEELEIHLCVLRLEKSKVLIEKQVLTLQTFQQLKEYIPSGIPIYVFLNGRGILHKKVNLLPQSEEELVQTVLPGAKASDFYTQEFQQEKNAYISIVRKQLVQEVLNTFTALQLSVWALSLGAFQCVSLYSLLRPNAHNGELEFSRHRLTFLNETLESYTSLNTLPEFPKQIHIDQEKIDSRLLLSYIGALGVLLDLPNVEASIDTLQDSKDEFRASVHFKILSIGVLGLFLFVLLLNFVLFSLFTSQNNELSARENTFSGMLKEMEALEKEVAEKQMFLSGAGWLAPSRASYLADRIAATVPVSVRLTEMAVHPVDELKTKTERKTVFDTGKIRLSGNTTKPTILNEWVDELKMIDKIESTKLLQYRYDHKEKVGNFTIELLIKE
jgi:hypothetical protein